jgi:hypothetical protein
VATVLQFARTVDVRDGVSGSYGRHSGASDPPRRTTLAAGLDWTFAAAVRLPGILGRL